MTHTSQVRSILVVDDDMALRKIMETWCRMAGYEVSATSGRSDVLAQLQSRHFDLIVTDVLMPDFDGTEVINAAKKYQPGASILAISGGGVGLSPDVCLAIATGVGAGAPLMKPFGKDEFLAAVQRAITPPGDAPKSR